jgi:YidC/Oxa1 family membrane protein insertase
MIYAAPAQVSPFAAMSSRNLSWTPWKRSTTDAPVSDPSTIQEVTATTTAEPARAALNTDIPSAAVDATSAGPSTGAVPTPQAAELLPQSPANASVPSLEELITNSGKPLEEVLNSPEAVHAAMKVSDLGLVGLDHGFLSIFGWTRDALVGMHMVTGLPWYVFAHRISTYISADVYRWATIAALTISIRLCLFPLVVRMTKHNIRFQAVNPQFTALMKRLNEAKQSRDQAQMAVVTQNLQGLMKENDVSPFRAFTLPLVQMPFFLAMFYGLRNFANTPLPQLKEGGFSWVTDLTMADPYWILPITSMALTNLVLIVSADLFRSGP